MYKDVDKRKFKRLSKRFLKYTKSGDTIFFDFIDETITFGVLMSKQKMQT